jgi:hypothetical protein
VIGRVCVGLFWRTEIPARRKVRFKIRAGLEASPHGTRGGIALTGPRPDPDEAEALFRRSLDLSRRQGARAWELRTAIDLSALLAARGWSDRARTLLQPVFEQFEEGLDTADPQAAARLLGTLEQQSGQR